MSKPRIVAFYLPQFYPTLENDEWWGKGFTEWTNVGRAKPLFRGHYQPKVPADLGYYDLRLPEVREEQAQMAKDAGIEGFCYWHYWFAGKRLLDRVFREVVESGKPDYPFCLCWANHSWYQKTWDPNKPNKLLMEQTYPGIEDYTNHFYAMLPAFKDKRYMKVNGKLIFGLFAPLDIPNVSLFFETWNKLAKENGLDGFYFFGFTYFTERYKEVLEKGFDSVLPDYTLDTVKYANSSFKYLCKRAEHKLLKSPMIVKYSDYVNQNCQRYVVDSKCHPCILPNYDHTPRSGWRGTVLHKSTPQLWGTLCRNVFNIVSIRNSEENLVFIKAWNEWGEGNYLEPDTRYGKEYLMELYDAYSSIK